LLRKSDSATVEPGCNAAWYATAAFLGRLARYGGVGVGVSLFYTLAVIACVHLWPPIGPTLASVIAFIITVPIAYFAHGNISFFDNQRDAFQPLRFAVTTAASFVLAVGGMYWITDIAGRSFLLGIAWTWLIIPAVNFVVYVLWVFRTTQTAGLGGSPAQSPQEHRFD
jgi:putative flippase GtrA